MEDGSAILPPIGSVTFRNVASRPKPSAKPASRNRKGTASNPARKFSVLNAPPQIVTASQATVNGSRTIPDLREREEQEEDLDEDRGVSDDLDVDRGELADDRDAMGTCRSQDEPDDEGAGDGDRRDLERAAEARQELVAVLGTYDQSSERNEVEAESRRPA